MIVSFYSLTGRKSLEEAPQAPAAHQSVRISYKRHKRAPSSAKMSCVLNHPAPDVALIDLETGDSHSLLEICKRTKKPTVVLFYATWSKACEQEVEHFEARSKDGHSNVANFVLVNLDQNVAKTFEFLDKVNPKTGKPRVCRDHRHEGAVPTVLHFGCNDVPEPYAVMRVPHKTMIDVDGVVRRNADDFHWDDIAGLLRHRSEVEALTLENKRAILFETPAKVVY